MDSRNIELIFLSHILNAYRLNPYFFFLNQDVDPVITPYVHQVYLLFLAMFKKPIRILIGDEIGLGKTIMVIVITKFLEERDNVERVLVLVPRILIEQWKSELKRFGIDVKI